MVVQNRCYANRGWDKEVRDFCKDNNIIYQGFSLLTANPYVLKAPQVIDIALRFNITPMQVIFKFSVQLGILPLTGTTNPIHMVEDLDILKFELTPDDLGMIQDLTD